MKRFLWAFAFALAFVARPASAQPTPQTTFCTPPNIFTQGTVIQAQPFNQNFIAGEQCVTQYGDLWTDGPLYNPAPTWNGTSFNITFPVNTFVVLGQRVPVTSIMQVVPASTVTYWWLEASSGLFTCTLNTGPPTMPCSGFNLPDSNADLEYTVTSNGSGITAVVQPTMANEYLNGSLFVSGLAAGCAQIGSGGVVTSTGLPCGSGSGAVAAVNGSGNINVATVSGTATVSETANPTWTGTPTTGSGAQAGSLNFGTDATAALSRTGASAFAFSAASPATLSVPGGVLSGTSLYGSTSASVNGGLTAASLTASGLSVGQCVQTTTGGLLTTTGSACAGLGNVLSVAAGASGNVTCSPTTGNVICDTVNAPTFTGAVTASSFVGSGAGLTAGTIPNTALATTPVTSVTGTSPIASSGGTTPAISIASNPGFTGTATAGSFRATGAIVAGSANAVIPTNPDLSASRSSSTGALTLGGTSSSCTIDYGVTSGTTITVPCNTNVGGTLAATTLQGTTLTSGHCVQASTGGILTTTSSACGSATSVTSVAGTSPISASTVSGAVTVACATCLTGLTAGSNIVAGTGTTPSVAVASAPSFSGGIGGDGNAAPAAGLQIGASSMAATIVSGTSSGTTEFNLATSTCPTNYLTLTSGINIVAKFLCTGALSIASTTLSGTSLNTGTVTASGAISGNGFTNTGLPSSTVTPLCGSNSSPQTFCGSLTPIFASTGNLTGSTGTSVSTYLQLGSTAATLLTGISGGPTGQWWVHAHYHIVGNTGTNTFYLYACLESNSTFTVQNATKTDGGAKCINAPSNSVAGGPGFGQVSGGGSFLGLAQDIDADVLVSNSTSITFTPFFAMSFGGTNTNAFGYVTLQATPI